MKYISVTDAKNRLDSVIDIAQQEPVTIRRRSQDLAVIVSLNDYKRLIRLHIEEFQNFRISVSRKAARRGLTEEGLRTIL